MSGFPLAGSPGASHRRTCAAPIARLDKPHVLVTDDLAGEPRAVLEERVRELIVVDTTENVEEAG